MQKETEQLEGTLQRIVFQSDTGFIIGSFIDKHNNKFTAVGNMINPQISMEYIFSGYWDENPKFGEQFKFFSYETIVPKDETGIFKYLVRICKFVGPAIGNALIDEYGDKTIEIMKTDPDRVANDISGITLDRAKEIQQTLLANEVNEKIMVELESMLNVPGMRKNLPVLLINDYKSEAAEIVKKNPYILTQFYGIGFALADRVALNIGCARDSIFRKEAAAMHCLHQNMQEGSTWIDIPELINKVQELIQVPELSAGIYSLCEKGVVVIEDDAVALAWVAEDEAYIAEAVTAMEARVI